MHTYLTSNTANSSQSYHWHPIGRRHIHNSTTKVGSINLLYRVTAVMKSYSESLCSFPVCSNTLLHRGQLLLYQEYYCCSCGEIWHYSISTFIAVAAVLCVAKHAINGHCLSSRTITVKQCTVVAVFP